MGCSGCPEGDHLAPLLASGCALASPLADGSIAWFGDGRHFAGRTYSVVAIDGPATMGWRVVFNDGTAEQDSPAPGAPSPFVHHAGGRIGLRWSGDSSPPSEPVSLFRLCPCT